ncbi:methylmalonyl Co-A mutase-associated GTPase MeaB [Myxococcota bacterium]|nr:methylmalonyl Co-A mutase-associated GTPase MeaB [Myxococcota bacterium]
MRAVDEPKAFAEAIVSGDRRALARAITLIESRRSDQQEQGQAILDCLIGETGRAIRVGITGPPGVGKSTFIESLGQHVLDAGSRLAVLAVDPSSPVTGGSILGDKTRMERLATAPNAFVRPSPSGGSLGGVAGRTREAMLLCEAAGYGVILIETVGIGQSEVAVHSMVDFFLVLLLPAGGDELQGIKRGVMELADAVVVNKSDGDTLPAAERTRQDYENALGLLRPPALAWTPVALMASALTGRGIPEVWETVQNQRNALEASAEFEQRRRRQARDWMWSLIEQGLRTALEADPVIARRAEALEEAVQSREKTPSAAARALLADFLNPPS